MAKRRLLIIDSQPTIRWALRNYFESRDYEIAEAESGTEALVQFQRFAPEALAMDCHLPDEDAKKFVHEINSVLPGVPIIMVSSYRSIDQAIHAVNHSGSNDEASKGLPLVEVEKRHIQIVLRNNQGNVEKSATMLGISRSSLYERVKRYGIQHS
jgi:DNA-binding NtrC family response regulator